MLYQMADFIIGIFRNNASYVENPGLCSSEAFHFTITLGLKLLSSIWHRAALERAKYRTPYIHTPGSPYKLTKSRQSLGSNVRNWDFGLWCMLVTYVIIGVEVCCCFYFEETTSRNRHYHFLSAVPVLHDRWILRDFDYLSFIRSTYGVLNCYYDILRTR